VAPSQPPVPPHYFGFGTQSTSYYGAKIGNFLVAIATALSTTSVVAKAQHDPHPP